MITKYNMNLKNCDMNYIKNIEKTYDRVLKSIYLQVEQLFSKIPDK